MIVYSGFAVTPYLKFWSWKISDIKTGKFDGSCGNDWCSSFLENQLTKKQYGFLRNAAQTDKTKTPILRNH